MIGKPKLDALLKQARAVPITPEQRRQQRRNWIAAEMIAAEIAIGSDHDEAMYRAALLQGDEQECERLNAAAAARRQEALALMDKLGF